MKKKLSTSKKTNAATYTGRWIKIFLKQLSKVPNVGMACKVAGIDRGTAYNLRSRDNEFRKQWEKAINQAVDILEKEMWRRAVIGTKEPVYFKGKECGKIKKYSDTLAIFMAKAYRPKKYRERYEVNHNYRVLIQQKAHELGITANDFRKDQTLAFLAAEIGESGIVDQAHGAISPGEKPN